jgi:hypothetical protein
MDFTMLGLVVFALPLVVGFLLVYWAVRLAIRHEHERELRQRAVADRMTFAAAERTSTPNLER